MADNNNQYVEWVQKLVKTCLPLDLQKKILYHQPLTKDEIIKFKDVIELSVQAKGLADHQSMAATLNTILRNINALNNKTITAIALNKIAIWYASGFDPKFKPDDARVVNAIKELMIVEGLDMLAKDGSLSERSVANHLVYKYKNIPGAYDDVETLRRALNRKNRLK